MICSLCPNNCDIKPGQTGKCRARMCIDPTSEDIKRFMVPGPAEFSGTYERIIPINYGKISAAALDPIEKKPLRRYKRGSMILSVGSFGCNLSCPFCQNHRISMTDIDHSITKDINPYQLLDAANEARSAGSIGVAFTYNEPLIGYEYVLDCAKLLKKAGLDVVLVTNGCICEEPLKELLPYVDAMNIDLKAFNAVFYKRISGDFETVKRTIEISQKACHVELTTLIIPGENDSADEMHAEADWIASLNKDIPLHISRFFPAYDYAHKAATDVRAIYELVDIARGSLNYVYTGNC